MNYSENIFRGISSTDWVRDGLVTAAAFVFTEQIAENGWMQQSICWEDDASVVDFMLQQKKNDQFQFKAGIARVRRESIEYINKLPISSGIVSYERDVLPDNQYHGNLLLSIKSNKTQRTLVAALIASHVSDFIPR